MTCGICGPVTSTSGFIGAPHSMLMVLPKSRQLRMSAIRLPPWEPLTFHCVDRSYATPLVVLGGAAGHKTPLEVGDAWNRTARYSHPDPDWSDSELGLQPRLGLRALGHRRGAPDRRDRPASDRADLTD